jgi:broad specificity phosphatase PhoE
LTWDDIQTLDPPILMIRVGADLHTVNPRGGEPFEEVWERARKFRRFVFEKYAGSDVLVVSHGVFLQMFHGVLRGLNCIESLASYPANLEMARFRFVGRRLADEEVVRLSDAVLFKW